MTICDPLWLSVDMLNNFWPIVDILGSFWLIIDYVVSILTHCFDPFRLI